MTTNECGFCGGTLPCLTHGVTQETPVAWRFRYHNEKKAGGWMLRQSEPEAFPDMDIEPLYASPVPSGQKNAGMPWPGLPDVEIDETSDILDLVWRTDDASFSIVLSGKKLIGIECTIEPPRSKVAWTMDLPAGLVTINHSAMSSPPSPGATSGQMSEPEATPTMVMAGIEACDGRLHARTIRKVWAAMQAASHRSPGADEMETDASGVPHSGIPRFPGASSDKSWTPAKFWEYAAALVGELEADQMRDHMQAVGLSIVSSTDESDCDCPTIEGELNACELLRKQVSLLRDQVEEARASTIEECAKIARQMAKRCVREQIAGANVAAFIERAILALPSTNSPQDDGSSAVAPQERS